MHQKHTGRHWDNLWDFIFLILQQLAARLDRVDFSFVGQGRIGQDYVARLEFIFILY